MYYRILVVLVLVLIGCEGCEDTECGCSSYPDAGEDRGHTQGTQPHIVGGWEAYENELPYQVSLMRPQTGLHFCGATLIGPLHVLSAAHCTTAVFPFMVTVILGEHSRVIGEPPAHRVYLDVAEVINHEDYDITGVGFINDISVIRLLDPQPYNASQWAACLPDPARGGYPGQTGIVSGWGSLAFGQIMVDTLRITRVPIMTREDCRRAWLGTIDDGMICGGDLGDNARDACQGDDGGPLAVKDSDGRFYVVGVVSFGEECATRWPRVYTNVTHYLDWMVDKMRPALLN